MSSSLFGAGPPDVSLASAAARSLLLLATAVVAGTALLRPVTGRPGRAQLAVVWSAAAVAAVTSVTAVFISNAQPPAAAGQAAVTLAAAALLAWPWPAAVTGALLVIGVAVEAVLGKSGFDLAAGIAHTAAASVWAGAAVAVATAAGSRRELARRLAPAAVVAGVLLVVTGILQAGFDHLGLDSRLYTTAFGQVLLLKSVLVLAVAVAGLLVVRGIGGRWTSGLLRAQAAALAVAVAAGGALVAVNRPEPLPSPGVPLLREVAVGTKAVPVLVAPGRPGINLVHIGGVSSGGRIGGGAVSVGTSRDRLVRASSRPGVGGTWATVDLPAGASSLWISSGGRQAAVSVDTGPAVTETTASGVSGVLAGPDGPECASAVLGSVLAGSDTPVRSCPSDRLSAGDATSLRLLVGDLAARHVKGLTLVSDPSPRSAAAARVVRAAAAGEGISVGSPTQAAKPSNGLIIVSGFATAESELKRELNLQSEESAFTSGTYLAPWLLSGPLVNESNGVLSPLRFDPKGGQAAKYASALSAYFGSGEAPTPTGYAAWTGAGDSPETGPTEVYAAARVGIMPMDDFPDVWYPNESFLAVTKPLNR